MRKNIPREMSDHGQVETPKFSNSKQISFFQHLAIEDSPICPKNQRLKGKLEQFASPRREDRLTMERTQSSQEKWTEPSFSTHLDDSFPLNSQRSKEPFAFLAIEPNSLLNSPESKGTDWALRSPMEESNLAQRSLCDKAKPIYRERGRKSVIQDEDRPFDFMIPLERRNYYRNLTPYTYGVLEERKTSRSPFAKEGQQHKHNRKISLEWETGMRGAEINCAFQEMKSNGKGKWWFNGQMTSRNSGFIENENRNEESLEDAHHPMATTMVNVRDIQSGSGHGQGRNTKNQFQSCQDSKKNVKSGENSKGKNQELKRERKLKESQRSGEESKEYFETSREMIEFAREIGHKEALIARLLGSMKGVGERRVENQKKLTFLLGKSQQKKNEIPKGSKAVKERCVSKFYN